MSEWTTEQWPHRARRSFDFAQCVCGWYWSDDDIERLESRVNAHNEAFDGHLIAVDVKRVSGLRASLQNESE